jgi:hypothetical protein
MKTLKTTMPNTIVESRAVKRDYGFDGTEAIVDTEKHGRLLIMDGFGGMDELRGGTVRWEHGSVYQLQPGDTFETLDEDSDYSCCGERLSRLRVVVEQSDPSRPWVDWSGHALAGFARKLFNS